MMDLVARRLPVDISMIWTQQHLLPCVTVDRGVSGMDPVVQRVKTSKAVTRIKQEIGWLLQTCPTTMPLNCKFCLVKASDKNMEW